MEHPYYEFTGDNECIKFSFVSEGRRKILKGIHFQSMGKPDLYNLAMGDLDEFGDLDVFSESNNGDMEKVLATTVQVVIQFFTKHPETRLFLRGSTPSRTRLYQIIINKELLLLQEHFVVYGLLRNNFEIFEIDRAYMGFAIVLKK